MCSSVLAKMVHVKCRSKMYPFSNISRVVFPDSLVDWGQPFPDYSPEEYNSPGLKGKPYADPDLDNPNFHPKWNSLDGNINRKSHIGDYTILNGRPLNPKGRTGIKGRGVLGRWGPNHAADPIVTRWKMNNGIKILHTVTKLAILQFCAIQRHDTLEWALPGGMVDPGEQVSVTLKREFMEEAMNSLQSSAEQLEKNKQMVENFFNTGKIVYKGYVDDPRNTDNAWIETVAANFHDEDGTSVGKFELNAGDDAKNVKWMDIDKNLNLYASHSQLIQQVATLRGAHW